MIAEVREFGGKTLVGMRLEMSFGVNRTGELWKSFMLRRKEIRDVMGTDLYSVQRYPAGMNFRDPNTSFHKWATVETASTEHVPDGMEVLVIPKGVYAVFLHQGPASDAPRTFGYIFGVWLPSSGYRLDDRLHFEILGAKYKNNAADSEEEVWIPIAKVSE